MFQKARQVSYLESTSLLVFLFKWKKPLGITCAVALLASIIFSGENFIKPRFKSSVIFFPTSTNSVSKALLDETANDKQDILAFGEEEQAEQLLQILNSDYIRNSIVSKYNLMEHYDIDPEERYPLTRLYEKYLDNISFRRTEFMSVRIDVLDTDPQMAANMANDIAALLDSMKTKMQRDRALEALKIVEHDLQRKRLAIQQKEDSLRTIRRLGMIDYKNQALVWNEEYAKSYSALSNERAALPVLEKYKGANDSAVINTRARVTGAEARVKSLEEKLKILSDYGGASIALNEELTLEREEMTRVQQQFDKLKVDAEQNMPHKFVVNEAVKAEKKSYPIRWLIVLISVFSTFLLCSLTILLLEKVKDIRYNL
jgi:hypothetical protein